MFWLKAQGDRYIRSINGSRFVFRIAFFNQIRWLASLFTDSTVSFSFRFTAIIMVFSFVSPLVLYSDMHSTTNLDPGRISCIGTFAFILLCCFQNFFGLKAQGDRSIKSIKPIHQYFVFCFSVLCVYWFWGHYLISGWLGARLESSGRRLPELRLTSSTVPNVVWDGRFELKPRLISSFLRNL